MQQRNRGLNLPSDRRTSARSGTGNKLGGRRSKLDLFAGLLQHAPLQAERLAATGAFAGLGVQVPDGRPGWIKYAKRWLEGQMRFTDLDEQDKPIAGTTEILQCGRSLLRSRLEARAPRRCDQKCGRPRGRRSSTRRATRAGPSSDDPGLDGDDEEPPGVAGQRLHDGCEGAA